MLMERIYILCHFSITRLTRMINGNLCIYSDSGRCWNSVRRHFYLIWPQPWFFRAVKYSIVHLFLRWFIHFACLFSPNMDYFVLLIVLWFYVKVGNSGTMYIMGGIFYIYCNIQNYIQLKAHFWPLQNPSIGNILSYTVMSCALQETITQVYMLFT